MEYKELENEFLQEKLKKFKFLIAKHTKITIQQIFLDAQIIRQPTKQSDQFIKNVSSEIEDYLVKKAFEFIRDAVAKELKQRIKAVKID